MSKYVTRKNTPAARQASIARKATLRALAAQRDMQAREASLKALARELGATLVSTP